MRLLFLAGQAPDYLQDAVYHGLVQVLGGENVLEYPQVARYHGGSADPRAPMLRFDVPAPADAHLPDLVRWADAIVAGSLRDDAIDSVRETLRLRGDRPFVVLDGDDHPYVRGIVSDCDAYFKRETLVDAAWLRTRMPLRRLYHRRRRSALWADPLRREVGVATASSRRITPLPFGIVDTGFRPAVERDIDIVFLAGPTSQARERVAAALRACARDGLTVRTAADVPGGRLDWNAYMDMLSRSRIGLSVHGLGYDTYRYWEIPYAGALLLAEIVRTIVPNNFVDGEEAVFAPLACLVDRAIELARGDTAAIAEAGRAALLARHTSVQRAQTVLARLRSA